MYPGVLSISILIYSTNPEFFFNLLNTFFRFRDPAFAEGMILLFMETWSAFCMLCAWGVFRLEYKGVSPRITNFLLTIVGYGPLLSTIYLAAYIAEFKNPSLKWDKTEKASAKRAVRTRVEAPRVFDFAKELAKDIRREYQFFCRQMISLAVVISFFFIFY